jgi:DNA-binding CsgD family transcriptional regulator/PAS domain-containing protein
MEQSVMLSEESATIPAGKVKPKYDTKLLKFSTRLKPDSENFRLEVLRHLDDIFGFNKVAFSYISEDGYFSDLRDLNIQQDDFKLYKDKGSKHDFFAPVHTDGKKRIYRIGDFMSYEEFERTEIHDILSNCGMYYEAVIYLYYRQNPVAALMFLREKEKNDFTEEDLELFDMIRGILEYQLSLHLDIKDFSKEIKEKQLMQKALRNLAEGVILCDDNFHVLYANDAVSSFLPSLYNTENGYEKFITEKLLPVFERQGQQVFFIHELPGITITLKSFFTTDAGKKLQPVYEILFMQNPLKTNRGWTGLAAEKLLTNREKEICDLTLQGLDNYQIAEHLNISVHTCKRHLENIYRKLGVSRRFELFTLFQRYC